MTRNLYYWYSKNSLELYATAKNSRLLSIITRCHYLLRYFTSLQFNCCKCEPKGFSTTHFMCVTACREQTKKTKQISSRDLLLDQSRARRKHAARASIDIRTRIYNYAKRQSACVNSLNHWRQ